MREVTEQEVQRLVLDEGFRGMPYTCPTGHLTIGIGTLLPLTEEEARWLMHRRWKERRWELRARYKQLYGESLDLMPTLAVQALDNAVYALGPPKLMLFRKMWAAIRARDWGTAAAEMIDSRWHGQAPARVGRLADWMRRAAG